MVGQVNGFSSTIYATYIRIDEYLGSHYIERAMQVHFQELNWYIMHCAHHN